MVELGFFRFGSLLLSANQTTKSGIKGEGYFEVAKDASKPFIVETGTMEVQVLGTHFNVMAYADEGAIKTTLIEGSVKLSNNSHQTLIRPGQQGTLLPGNTEKFAVHEANLEEVIAWKEGRFRFDEMNISFIMRQISRWYDVEILYEGDLSDIRLSGSVPRKENPAQLLKALEMSGSVRFETKGNKIVVKPLPTKTETENDESRNLTQYVWRSERNSGVFEPPLAKMPGLLVTENLRKRFYHKTQLHKSMKLLLWSKALFGLLRSVSKQALLIMRLTAILLLAFTLSVNARTFSQTITPIRAGT